MIRKRILAGLLLLWPSIAPAQWKAVYKETRPSDTLYNIHNDSHCKPDGKLYAFPEYDAFDETKTEGYELYHNNNLVWQGTFTAAFQIKDKYFYCRPYLKNIVQYKVFVWMPADKTCYYKTFQTSFEGYQVPLNEKLAEWKKYDTILPAQSNSIIITAQVKNASSPASLAVSDLLLLNDREETMVVKHSFFNILTNQPIADTLRPDPVLFSNMLLTGTGGETKNYLRSFIWLYGPAGEAAEMQLLKKLLPEILERYPFYDERQLDKTKILQAYQHIADDTLSYHQFVDSVAGFVNRQFRDGHFYITDSPAPPANLVRPIRLFAKGNEVFVGAVFDTRYQQQLPPGTKITEIDKLPVYSYLRKNYPELEELSNGIGKMRNDSLLLVTAEGKKICVKYDGKISIPENFKPQHGEFRWLDNDIAYFRINSWLLDVYLRFCNNRDAMAHAKGLVIDLRGNGGGELLSALRMLAPFISEPTAIYSTFPSSTGTPLSIAPDRSFHLPDGIPIVLLCDKNTACASEIFIKALKDHHANVQLIGTGKTAGAFAVKIGIHLPSGVMVYTNSIIGKIIFPDGKSIEHIGLQPDIVVKINTVDDLRPYGDKVVRTAITALRTQSTQGNPDIQY